jgi:DNA-directed RNA polymerase specialized sigma24 family protein
MSSSSDGSVTRWIESLKSGDPEAVRAIWDRYFKWLVSVARRRLQGLPRVVADEEDVAATAMESLWQGAQRGAYPELHNREDLWRLLVVITVRKASHVSRNERRQKRGDGKVIAESDLAAGDSPSDDVSIERIMGNEPTLEVVGLMSDELKHLLEILADPTLQSLALLKMEGYANDEVAAKLGCGLRTVERKLQQIRTIWEKENVQ